MAHGARTSLAALVLCLALGIPCAPAQPSPAGAASGTAWTDPPARKAGAEKPAMEAAKPAPPSATPAAVSRIAEPAPAPARKVAAKRPRPAPVARREEPVRKRVAAVPRRTREAAAGRVRPAQARPPRMVAANPPARARAPRVPGFGGYYSPYGYGPGYADDRLERLSAAQAAGYIVMRRGSVEFPDGRSLRVYRPTEDVSPF